MVCTSWCYPLSFDRISLNSKIERYTSLRNICKCALRDYMSRCLAKTRHSEKLSQERFSEQLLIDTRSYADLERGEYLCCTLTFILFLVFHCDDVDAVLQDMKRIILDACGDDFPWG